MNRILILLVFALTVFSYYLHSRINEIDSQRQHDTTMLHEEIGRLQQAFSEELKKYVQINSVSQISAESPEQSLKNEALQEKALILRTGLYVAELNVQVWNEARTRKVSKQFSLYHAREMVQGDGKPYPLNVGIAFSGLTSVPLFYIDYDNDGNIDLDIMQEFVYFLPGGRLLARSIDPARAQAVYEAFLHEQQNASYYSSDEIKNSGSKLSTQLWDFMHEKSSELGAWIATHTPVTPGSSSPAPVR